MVKVGNHEKKEVTELNHELYTEMLDIMECNQHQSHMGLSGLGAAVDWLEENYILIKKEV